jgi:uncharacterized protein (TIGR03435 family)
MITTFVGRLSKAACLPKQDEECPSAIWSNKSGARTACLFLGLISLGVLSGPAYGQCSKAGAVEAQDDRETPSLKFDVVSIRQFKGDGWFSKFTEDGYSGTGVPVSTFIRAAFDQVDGPRIFGMPEWARTTYTIQAKVGGSDVAAYQKLSPHQRSVMLQTILTERFKFMCHHEMRDLPVFALTVAKGGPLLSSSEPGPAFTDGNVSDVHFDGHGILHIVGKPLNMAGLAKKLSYQHDVDTKLVIDKTGLKGYYRFDLFWASPQEAKTNSEADTFGPSVYTAVREQLGLQLKPTNARVDTIVIDHIEQPTPN